MSPALWWLLLALVLGGVELLSGTFYLLILALGAGAGALAAWMDASLTWQLVACAAISLAAWAGLRGRRERGDRPLGADGLDAGATVTVAEWREPRVTVVRYRGAPWRAELAAEVVSPAPPGEYRIVRVDGTRLVIAPR
ncbi:MAG: NfeD family protein [Burkholderiaceae bacterium]